MLCFQSLEFSTLGLLLFLRLEEFSIYCCSNQLDVLFFHMSSARNEYSNVRSPSLHAHFFPPELQAKSAVSSEKINCVIAKGTPKKMHSKVNKLLNTEIKTCTIFFQEETNT